MSLYFSDPNKQPRECEVCRLGPDAKPDVEIWREGPARTQRNRHVRIGWYFTCDGDGAGPYRTEAAALAAARKEIGGER